MAVVISRLKPAISWKRSARSLRNGTHGAGIWRESGDQRLREAELVLPHLHALPGAADDDLGTAVAIEIAGHRPYAVASPRSELLRITQHGVDSVAAKQERQGTARDITAADDKKFLHDAILPDSS